MTAQTSANGITSSRVSHPLDPLQPEELELGRQILVSAGLVSPTTRFAYFGLDEPAKAEVLATGDSPAPDRRLRAFLIDLSDGASQDVVVSLKAQAVVGRRVLEPGTEGHMPILTEDFARIEKVVHEDQGWRQAMAKRGLHDVSKIRTCPLTAGSYVFPGEEGRRLVRVLAFLQETPHDLAWGRPIDGVAAYVDLIQERVIKLVDDMVLAVPAEGANYEDPAVSGPPRATLRPIEVTQPEGTSLRLQGNRLEWDRWSMRIGFDGREGLVIYQVSYQDQGRWRPVIYRASVPEMVVPYGDPSPARFFQAYFDSGEFLLGRYANSLQLGCDCLGEITYLDAVVADDEGNPRTIANAICLHEEDFGVLWKHTDIFNGSAQTRRQRRLVVSFFCTVGNYDYGFYWYFYLDGTIELEVKMTGVIFTSAYPGPGYPYATEVAPGLGGPSHQHLFGARLDMMVDGMANAVEEVDVVAPALGSENPWGNAITRSITRLRSEGEGRRQAEPSKGRYWRVVNTEKANYLGQPVAYGLVPQVSPTLLADAGSAIAGRAGFATHHLSVTQYDPAHRYPAGDFVNQHPGGGGLPSFVAGDHDIDGADIVLWHTFGPTHFPRTEDWPVMPVERCGFTLKPMGFFDRNPTLDLPAPAHGHCQQGHGPGGERAGDQALT